MVEFSHLVWPLAVSEREPEDPHFVPEHDGDPSDAQDGH
jgi:hypothetical protein